MALAPSTTPPKKVVELFGPGDELPCHKAMTLTRSEVAQDDLSLPFVAEVGRFPRRNYPLVEVAIEFPENYSTNTISMEASMTSSHALWLYVHVDGDYTPASIHYTVDGIATIDSDHLFTVDQNTGNEGLPRHAIPGSLLSIAAGKDELSRFQLQTSDLVTISIAHTRHRHATTHTPFLDRPDFATGGLQVLTTTKTMTCACITHCRNLKLTAILMSQSRYHSFSYHRTFQRPQILDMTHATIYIEMAGAGIKSR